MTLEIRNTMAAPTPQGVLNARAVQTQRIGQQPDAAPRQGIGNQQAGPNTGQLNPGAPDGPRIGFGQDTISIPGVAVNTVRQNFSNARTLVPDVEDEQERIRDRFAELRQQQAQEAEQRAGAQQTAAPTTSEEPETTRPISSVLETAPPAEPVAEASQMSALQRADFVVDDAVRVPDQPGAPMLLNMLV